MRTLKANLEKELKEVDQNIKRLNSNEPIDESPWDDFVSFLLPTSVSFNLTVYLLFNTFISILFGLIGSDFATYFEVVQISSTSSSNSHSSTPSDNELSDSESNSRRGTFGDIPSPVPVIPLPVSTVLAFSFIFISVDIEKTAITFKQRTRVRAVVHVDCAAYYEAIAYAMDKATKDIFITCWFLTPELYLVRDPIPNPLYPLPHF